MVAHPDISFPNRGWNDEDLLPHGYAVLWMPNEHPFPGRYEKLVETTPNNIDGKWYIQFEVVAMTEDEIKTKNSMRSAEILYEREQLLKNSDWTQLPDVDLIEEEVQQWRTYRQALRDITDQPGYPWDINFPTINTQ